MTLRQIGSWLVRLAVLALIVMLMVFGKLYCRSAEHYKRAEELYGQDKLGEAMVEYEGVINNYTPILSGRSAESARKLLEIGAKFEEADSLILAFRAYQSVTAALTGVQSIYEPYPELNRQGRERLERIKDKLSRIDRSRWQMYDADSTAVEKRSR